MQYAVEKGLNACLQANAAINALVNHRIANEFANKMEKPYIVFMQNAGQDTNQQEREQGDFRYAIKGVATDLRTAALIAAALRTALHEQPFAVDAPYTVYRCQHTTIVKYMETADNVQIYHHGGIYRIRVSEEL